MLLISSSVNNNTDLPLREDGNSINIKKLKPKRIISKEVDKEYEEKFQKLYITNKEFSDKFDNDWKYRNTLLNKDDNCLLDYYIEFLDKEYLLYTDSMFKILYKYNKKFQELYNNEEFINKYNSDEEYRDQINNDKEFLNLEYLLYTNSRFKELYDNYEEFRNKYDSDEKYRNNINDNSKFLNLEYLLYTNKKFKKLYNSNEEIRSVADQRDLYTYKSFKSFRPYDNFIEHYYNDKEFQKKIHSDREFMIDQILLYSNNHFIDLYYYNIDRHFKDFYDNNKDFRIAYRSIPRFRDQYYRYSLVERKKIQDNKEFFEAIVYVTSNETLYNIYRKNKIFSDLYEDNKTFQKLFLDLYKNNLEFQEKYNNDEIFRNYFNNIPKFREHCKCSYAKNLTTKF